MFVNESNGVLVFLWPAWSTCKEMELLDCLVLHFLLNLVVDRVFASRSEAIAIRLLMECSLFQCLS